MSLSPSPRQERFSPKVGSALAAAGWPFGGDRSSRLERWFDLLRPDGFEPFPAVIAALAEFGGLEITESGPGITMYRAPFRLVPTIAAGEGELFRDAAVAVGSDLYPLGDYDSLREFLAIARTGHVYMVMDSIWLVGASIDEAVTSLILGIKIELAAISERFKP